MILFLFKFKINVNQFGENKPLAVKCCEMKSYRMLYYLLGPFFMLHFIVDACRLSLVVVACRCCLSSLLVVVAFKMNDIVINKVRHKLRLNEITVCIYGRRSLQNAEINKHRTKKASEKKNNSHSQHVEWEKL